MFAAYLAKKHDGWGVLAGTAWVLLAFVAPYFVASFIKPFIELIGLDKNVEMFVMQGIVQAFTLLIIIGMLRLYRKKWSFIGLGEFLPVHVGWAIVCFPLYLVTSLFAAITAQALYPVNLEQQQEIGFSNVAGVELILVFIALVIIAPIVEEILFRGVLFKAYRRRFGFILGSVLVSVLFGLAHGQWNVAIDVFALSLILCYLREKTDSLWPCIVLHGLKNLVAFTILFIIGVDL